METIAFNAHIIHEVLKQQKFAAEIVITFQVMALPGMSPGHPDPIGPFAQGGQGHFRAHPSGAWDSDDPDVRRILQSADTGQICSAIAAPVA